MNDFENDKVIAEEVLGESRENIVQETINKKLDDTMIPGFVADFDPEEAELAGAFHEDALSERDAQDSVVDIKLPRRMPHIEYVEKADPPWPIPPMLS